VKRSIRLLVLAGCAALAAATVGVAGMARADTTTLPITPSPSTSSSMPTGSVDSCEDSTAAILDLPHQMFAAWGNGDAAGVAAVLTPDGHFIPSNGVYLVGRDQIIAYYTAAFAGPLKGTRVIGKPSSVRCLSPWIGVVDGLGGLLLPGETYTDPTQVPLGRRIIVSWTVVRVTEGWRMTEFQSTTIAG
jgi:uncharacterized protein (TIGR02246 family)